MDALNYPLRWRLADVEDPHPQAPHELTRVMGCTARDLLRWLPSALPEARLLIFETRNECLASFADGRLRIVWQTLPARRLARLELPQLHVRFCYENLADSRRAAIQEHFDRATHRGGG